MYDLEISGQFSEIHIDKKGGFCWKRSFHAPLPHVNHRELSILKSLVHHAHPNIVSLLHYEITDEEDDNLYIDFKFPCYDCSLLDWCSNSPTDEDKADCFIDLCSAVGHLHQLGILHRDINPSNIMMNSTEDGRYQPIIIDFGVAWSPDDTEGEAADEKVTQVATGSFRAPELLLGCTFYAESVDIWALGCTFAQVLHPENETLFDAGDGDSELMLLASIFRTIGTPSLQTWGDLRLMPSFFSFEFQHFDPQEWHALLPGIRAEFMNIISNMVTYQFDERMRATDAHKYLSEAFRIP